MMVLRSRMNLVVLVMFLLLLAVTVPLVWAGNVDAATPATHDAGANPQLTSNHDLQPSGMGSGTPVLLAEEPAAVPVTCQHGSDGIAARLQQENERLQLLVQQLQRGAQDTVAEEAAAAGGEIPACMWHGPAMGYGPSATATPASEEPSLSAWVFAYIAALTLM